jgi:hypothetical protein
VLLFSVDIHNSFNKQVSKVRGRILFNDYGAYWIVLDDREPGSRFDLFKAATGKNPRVYQKVKLLLWHYRGSLR